MARAANLHLRMVLPSYPWTRALEERRVRIPGVDYECAPEIENAPDRFDAFSQGAYDVGEDGVRRFVAERLQGAPPTALPVFFDREHLQRNIFVRADSHLTHPTELVGKRIGSRLSPHSGTGAGVLLMLERGYGMPLHEIKWHMGNPANLPPSRMKLDVAPGAATDRENFDLLFEGRLDAVISNLEGRYWSLFGPDLLDHESGPPTGTRPLISDASIIAGVYRDTGLYPITDVVVMRPQLIEEHPELPSQLMGAFSEANALASDYRSAIEEHLARQEVELLGEDPHGYGLSDNARKNLDAFIDLLYRLGAIEQPMAPEELFVPSIR
jgi:4,5-dihydroxyphthalate decarboxylase